MTRRTDRINELLREEISDLLSRHVKDPRVVGFITVTEVETATDLRHARVFVSVMGTEEEKKGAFSGLAAAAGFLRHELAERLFLRRIPDLTFVRDDSIERGTRILQIMKELEHQEGAPPPRPEGPSSGEGPKARR